MAEPEYKLSTILFGHTSDVRAVATFADGTVVSTSRDKTALVWKPTGSGRDYVSTATLKGHSNFVNAVCVINPSERNPKGLIITGGNDATICVYILDQVEPVKVIKAHDQNVCKLRTGKDDGTFFSSSWDLSAKLWDINDLSEPKLILKGHTSAVWCVEGLSNGSIVTGGADKLVIVWTRNGTIQHKLDGHTDCVRDIVAIKDNEFLTCANDATVRHWNASTGDCLGIYYGHANYIYSIVATENGTKVVTSSEDKNIVVWHNGKISQIIGLPCQSIWCTALMANGNIVAGSSDGVLRIFTSNPEKYAEAGTLQQFESEVANFQINAESQLGDLDIKNVPDASALTQPGDKDGQTKLVKEGGSVKAYNWSQREQKWQLIGDVLGSSGSTAATSGKQLYNGMEYDYVFSVDIQDGVPPLKLPYNNGQDPWHVAQKFLNDNDLSNLYLDQVANFIVKNSQAAPVLTSGAQYADPFTGGNRYIPETSNNTVQDSTKPASISSSNASLSSSYIPHTKYLKLEQANISAILEKLRELNSKQNDTSKVPEERLEVVGKLIAEQDSTPFDQNAVCTLKLLLNWPNESVFPVLDIARLAVLRKEVNKHLCTEELLQLVQRHVKPDASPSNQMLTFRLLANVFHHEKGEILSLTFKSDILKSLQDLDTLGSKNNQIAISTYILNLVVALNKYNDAPGRTQCLDVILFLLPRLNEPEAIFRILVGMGTLLSSTNSQDHDKLINKVRQSESALNILKTMSETTIPTNAPNKVANCSKRIIDLII